jgi:hypothetical protein
MASVPSSPRRTALSAAESATTTHQSPKKEVTYFTFLSHPHSFSFSFSLLMIYTVFTGKGGR